MLRGSVLSSSLLAARCSGQHRLALVRGAHTASQRATRLATVAGCNRPLGPGLLVGATSTGAMGGRQGCRALSSAASESSSRSVRVHISLSAVLLCGAAGYVGWAGYNGRLDDFLPEPQRAKEDRAVAALLNNSPSTTTPLDASSAEGSKLAPRPALVASLVSLISPRSRRCGYVVVYGEPGSGKSQAVGQAVSQAGPGVLYLQLRRGDAAEVEDGIKTLLQWEGGASHRVLQAIEQGRDWLAGHNRTNVSRGVGNGEGVMEVLHTLETAALRYREATGQSPTLVIDGVERLGTRDAAAFQALLQGAREAAGRGALSTVLVCGDGHVLRDMRGRECWSRSVDVVEVGDLGTKEAVSYLVEQRKLKVRDARRVVGLLGGRLVELNKAADALQDNDNWEAVEREAWQSMEACYSRLLRLLHTTNNTTTTTHKTARANKGPALSLLCALLEEPSGVLAYEDVCAHVGGPAMADALLTEGRGVLSLDASGWGVRFQSPMATHYALAVCKASGVRVRRRGGEEGGSVLGKMVKLAVLGGVGYWAYNGGAAGAVGGLQTLSGMSREELLRTAQDGAESVGQSAERAVARAREVINGWMQ